MLSYCCCIGTGVYVLQFDNSHTNFDEFFADLGKIKTRWIFVQHYCSMVQCKEHNVFDVTESTLEKYFLLYFFALIKSGVNVLQK